MSFEPAVRPPEHDPATARWLAVRRNQVLVGPAGELGVGADVADALAVGDEPPHYLGVWHGLPVWCRGVPDDTGEPEGHAFSDLYSLHARVDETAWLLAGRAVQIVEWGRTHRFCGRCGTPTEWAADDRSTRCPSCGLPFYPRLSPATITLVHRGPEVLLARGRLFPVPMYSALAGFVEPGESLEYTVRREVKEEVGVELADVRYVASQPWPFPNSLMLGFEAEYAGGDIVLDETELVDAQWFRVDDLPSIPGPISIAHRLITGYVERWRSG
jgi:NAD+ diphosphatase